MRHSPRGTFLGKSFRLLLPLLILGAGVIAFAAMSSQRPMPQSVEPEQRLPTVETVPVAIHQGGLQIRTDGIVVPHREVQLSAEVGGRIIHKAPECRPGRYVEKGQLLLTIDPREYQLEVDRLQRELDRAAVAIQEIDVELENTRALIALAEEKVALEQRKLERARELFRRSATSEVEYEDARQTELAARQDLTTLQNQLRKLETSRAGRISARELVEAQLAQAQLNVERTEVRAPMDGLVVSESVERDAYVQPGAALLLLEDISAIEVRCHLRMEELAWLWHQPSPESADQLRSSEAPLDDRLPQAPVTVHYRVRGQVFEWQGHLSRYEGIGLDERTRTVPCRVLVENPRDYRVSPADASYSPRSAGPRSLMRGMYVQLAIHAQPDADLLEVPEQAIQPGNRVWRVVDGKLNMIALHNLRILDDSVLVPADSSPLRPGDAIVVSPLNVAVEGMAVVPLETPALPPESPDTPPDTHRAAAAETARS